MDHIGREQNSDSQHDRPPRELQQAGLGAALGGVRGGVGCAALVLEPKGDSLWEVMDSLYDEERKKVLAKAERRLHKYNVNAWEFCVRKTMKAKLMKAATAVTSSTWSSSSSSQAARNGNPPRASSSRGADRNLNLSVPPAAARLALQEARRAGSSCPPPPAASSSCSSPSTTSSSVVDGGDGEQDATVSVSSAGLPVPASLPTSPALSPVVSCAGAVPDRWENAPDRGAPFPVINLLKTKTMSPLSVLNYSAGLEVGVKEIILEYLQSTSMEAKRTPFFSARMAGDLTADLRKPHQTQQLAFILDKVREAAKAGHQQIEMKPDVWLKDACRGTGWSYPFPAAELETLGFQVEELKTVLEQVAGGGAANTKGHQLHPPATRDWKTRTWRIAWVPSPIDVLRDKVHHQNSK